MKRVLIFIVILTSQFIYGQSYKNTDEINPSDEYDNISVKKLNGDERVSIFIIWVKKEVKEHYHAEHSEVVVVLEGSGQMTLGGESFEIHPRDYVFIPKGTPHSVRVNSNTPLKVISIQTPEFDGSDRVFTEN